MSILKSIMAGSGDRPAGHDDYWYMHPGLPTAAGVRISPESAMRQGDVYKCVNILSQTLATTPLILYRQLERGKERAKQHPVYGVLKKRPNHDQTAYDFKQFMMVCLALRGVFYGEIVPGPSGAVDQVLPLHPDLVEPERMQNGRIRYKITDQTNNRHRILLDHQVWKVMGLTLDGINPLSAIAYHRETVANGLLALKHGGRILANDGTPPLAISVPGTFKTEEDFDRFRSRWQKQQTGESKGKAAVLEKGTKLEKIGMSNTDMQYIETMKFTRSDIFGIFRIPLILSGEGDKTQTYASAEQFFLSFVKFTMMPWFTNIEQSAGRDLIPDIGREEFFAEFTADVWLRGDSKARSMFYKEGLNDGWLTRNEVRELENRNPLPGLDEPLQAMNMAGASDDIDDDEERDEDDDEARAEAKKAARSEVVAITEAAERHDSRESFQKWAATYYTSHRKNIRSALGLGIKYADAYVMDSFKQVIEAENVQDMASKQWEADRADYLYQLARLSR